MGRGKLGATFMVVTLGGWGCQKLGRTAEGDAPTQTPSNGGCASNFLSCKLGGQEGLQGNLGQGGSDPLLLANPMSPECRKKYSYTGTIDGSSVVESFEWDFSGDSAQGFIKYTKEGLSPVPLTVTLKFKESTGSAFVYEVSEIEGAGKRPDSVAFTCSGETMVQKETRSSSTSGAQERTFTLKSSS